MEHSEERPRTRRELLHYLATRDLWHRFEIVKEGPKYAALCTRTKKLCATHIRRIDDLTNGQWEKLLLDLEAGYQTAFRR